MGLCGGRGASRNVFHGRPRSEIPRSLVVAGVAENLESTLPQEAVCQDEISPLFPKQMPRSRVWSYRVPRWQRGPAEKEKGLQEKTTTAREYRGEFAIYSN